MYVPPETTRPLSKTDLVWARAFANAQAGTLVAKVASAQFTRLLGGAATLTVVLVGHFGYGWSDFWILMAFGVDFIAMWLTDLLRIKFVGPDWDVAAAAVQRRIHAVVTARCALAQRWLRSGPEFTAPDPRNEWGPQLRVHALVNPMPLLVVFATVGAWRLGPADDAPVGYPIAWLFLPFVVRPLVFAAETYRRRRGAELVDVALPAYPGAFSRLLGTVNLVMLTVLLADEGLLGADGYALLRQHSGVVAVLAGALVTCTATAYDVLKARRDAALLTRFLVFARSGGHESDDLAK